MIYRALFFVIVMAQAQAAIYHVDKRAGGASDSNPGTLAEPWLTIGKAASTLVAGDTVYVYGDSESETLYDERITETTSGTSDNWINYVAVGTVACRGFVLNGVSYVRIIGFEVYYSSAGGLRAIHLANTCSNIEILDNYVHNVDSFGVSANGTSSFITVRGNRFSEIGKVSGVVSNAVAVFGNNLTSSDHWLVEYNTVDWAADKLNVHGSYMIARNNRLRRFSNAFFGVTDAVHSDTFQSGGGTRHHLYEANFSGDDTEANSHGWLHQDTTSAGDTNILIRGNAAFNYGSGGVGVISTDHVSVYNNTFYKITQVTAGTVVQFYKGSGGSSDFSLSNLVANTLIYDYGLTTDGNALRVLDSSTATFDANWGYLAGTESSYRGTTDPLFMDAENYNFRLQSESPVIGVGTNIAWVTSGSGSGTTFDVNDGQLFTDGWELTDGDTITVGGTTTRITSISGNTITVADSVTWTEDMPVYWGTDTTPDIGAFPFGSAALTAATIFNNGDTYTVTPTGDARGVWFYIDGIPTTWDSTDPYSTTISSGTVTAKAYALYAQETPVITATSSGEVSTGGIMRGKPQFKGKARLK